MRYLDFFQQFIGIPRASSREGLALLTAAISLAVFFFLCAYVWLRRLRARAHVPDDEGELTVDGDGHDPAVAPLDDALAADPLAVAKRRERGLYYFRKGNYDLAIQDFHVWVAQAPKASDAYRYRGDAWRKLGFDDLAIADYRRALRLEPSNAAARDGVMALQQSRAADRAAPRPSVPSLTALLAKELHAHKPNSGRPAAKSLRGP